MTDTTKNYIAEIVLESGEQVKIYVKPGDDPKMRVRIPLSVPKEIAVDNLSDLLSNIETGDFWISVKKKLEVAKKEEAKSRRQG